MYEKIEALLAQCTPGDAREAQDIACLRRYLAAESNLLTRENTAMHLTASAWIVGAGGERVLLQAAARDQFGVDLDGDALADEVQAGE